jgi:hypothetical protein
MSYLPINIAGARLLIGGTDYSNEFVSLNVSDDSVITSNIITTTGQIILAQSPGGQNVADILAANFSKGKVVTIDIQQPNGEFIRHPRGYLYILRTSYSIENKLLTIDVGCGLAYGIAYEDQSGTLIENLVSTFVYDNLVQIIPAQSLTPWLESQSPYDFNFIGEGLEAKGECIYQDRWGYFQKVNIFGDGGFYSSNTNVPYKFSAYDQYTCLSIEPQSSSGTKVDKVVATADTSVFGQEGDETIDEDDEIQQEEEEFLPYGDDATYDNANSCQAKGLDKPSDKQEDITKTTQQFENPAYAELGDSVPQFLTDIVETENIKYNRGPGYQLSEEKSYTRQDSLNRNSGEWSSVYQAKLNAGFSPAAAARSATSVIGGVKTVERTNTYYHYGKGGELIRKDTYVYGQYVNLMTEEEKTRWYPTVGEFLYLGPSPFDYADNLIRQETTSYRYNISVRGGPPYNEERTSATDFASRATQGGSGYTYTVRRSSGNLVNPSIQDNVATGGNPNECAPENQTTESRPIVEETGIDEIVTFTGDGLAEAGMGESLDIVNVDYPLDLPTAPSIESLEKYKQEVQGYSESVYNKLKADERGFTIQEALRPEFYSWYPAYPYKLILASENKAFYMRISSGTWSVTPNESVCSFESMMIAEYKNPSVTPPAENSQLQYLIPETISPTTANNQITNHESALGVNVRRVTINLSPSPSPSTVSVPVTSLPTATSTILLPIVKVGAAIKFRFIPRLIIKELTPIPLPAAQAPLAMTFAVPVQFSVLQFAIDFKTIANPETISVNMNTISNPSALNVDAGTITAPLF